MGVNSVRDNDLKHEYIMKLVPDFGVFDIAEKYFIDNNLAGVQKLFFYGESVTDIKFRRFMVRSESNIEIKITGTKTLVTSLKNSECGVFRYDLISNGFQYAFVIYDNMPSGSSFTVSSSSNVIGVCF